MSDLTNELHEALGDDGFFALTEAHAGMRLYIPGDPARSDLEITIGANNAVRLSKLYAGGYISVPLAREFRALRYRDANMNNREIARKLGLTESGLDRLFGRARGKDPDRVKSVKSKKDPRQIEMF